MLPGSLERDFEEFRAHGTPKALGRVFDRAAPDLLIVAGHMARDAATAEDLVQGTFLAAIEHAQSWDRKRLLMPWLVTILLNQARQVIRRENQKRHLAGEHVLPHPIEDAEANEIAELIARATSELPAPYHEVLALKLAHGLDARAIAHALRRPLETVKTQIKRGTELLRRALPRSLVPALALAASRERGLAAVRAAVLGRVGAGTAGTSIVAVLGGLVLMKKLLASIAALIVALLAWWSWPERSVNETAPTAGGSHRAAPATPLGAATSRPTAAEPRRQEVLATGPEVARPQARIRGRCVKAEDLTALAGVHVLLTAKWPDAAFRAAFGKEPWRQDSVPVTGGDGRFALEVPSVHGLVYALELRTEGRLPRLVRLHDLAAGSDLDLGDVPQPTTVAVSGVVTDEAGEAVAGATLEVAIPEEVAGLRTTRNRENMVRCHARSDPRGRFAFEPGLPPGTWNLQVNGRIGAAYLRLLRPGSLNVPQTGGLPEVSVTVRADPTGWMPLITARIVDEHELPVADMPVLVGHERGGGYWERSDEQGRLEFPWSADGHWILRAPATEEHAGIAIVRGLRGDERDLVLRTTTMPPLTLRVSSSAGGEPLERYAIAFVAEGKETDPLVRHVGTHPGGVLALEHAPTAGALRVIPERDDLSSTEIALAPFGAGAREIRVAVTAAVPVPVRVLRADARPMPDVRVELIDFGEPDWGAAEEGWFRRAWAKDDRAFFRGDREREQESGRSGAAQFLLSAARTGADGRAVLRAPRTGMQVAAYLPGPGHVPLLRRNLVLGSPIAEIVLRVEGVAELVGRITPREVLRLRGLEVWLRSDERPGMAQEVPLDAEGGFYCQDVPAGDWVVRLHHGNGNWENRIAELPVRLVAGERREVTLDASALCPVDFTGRVRIVGVPAGGADLRPVYWPQGRLLTLAPVWDYSHDCVLDAQGRFTVAAAPAGQYAFLIRVDPDRPTQRTFVTRRYAVTAAGPNDLEIDLTPRSVRIRAVDAATRAPIANRKILLDTRVLCSFEPTTDADGCATLPFTPGEELFARFEGGDAEQGPFAVPRDDRVLEIALDTGAARR